MKVLPVRRGFLFGAALGFGVAGSSLWALTTVQQMLHPPALEAPAPLPTLLTHRQIPAHLIWFFVQYGYVSEKASVKELSNHSAVISDPVRGKEYVVSFGQQFRRVEIYSKQDKAQTQIHVFTPGSRRVVQMSGGRVVSDASQSDANTWMWRTPLWTPQHLKIFNLADFWLHSPYKRYSCAGFVQKYLEAAGVKVPVLDAWDMAKQPWKRVSLEEAEPGDIIALKAASDRQRRQWGHTITHVGVYIGNGRYIHAATSSRKAKRSFIRLGDIEDVKHRIARILRPPELL